MAARHATTSRRQCGCEDLGTRNGRSEVDSIRPFVLQTIEAFGVARSMFASNFPVTNSSATLTLYAAFHEITACFSAEERQMLFHDNAAVTTGSWMFLSQR